MAKASAHAAFVNFDMLYLRRTMFNHHHGNQGCHRMAITTATITNTMQHLQHGQTLAGRTLERVSRPMLLRVRIRQAMAQLASRMGRVRSVSVDFA